MSIVDNYKSVIERVHSCCVKSNINFDKITVLPISKTAQADDMLRLINYGVTSFGESRLQDSIKKLEIISAAVNDKIELQFIGRIQHNKLKKIIETFSLIHSVSDVETVNLIDKISSSLQIIKPILIQLNLAKEGQKAGVYYEQLGEILQYIMTRKNILLKGFMLIPPYENNPEQNIKYFKKAKDIFDIYSKLNPSIDVLSMGMSGDFELALQEGATLLRIGSTIFNHSI